MRRTTSIIATLLTLTATGLAAQTPPAIASDSEIRALLISHVDAQHKAVGIVVGIITPQGRRFVSYGQLNQGDARAVDANTVFEIGSVTKIFTALLLADMVQKHEVALTDPVAKYLPPGTTMPERGGRQITLVDLATHTSALPYMVSGVPADLAEAGLFLAQYPSARLYQFLSTYQLPLDIGARWTYSNVGFSVLGDALARRAGTDYESLITRRITGPLGLTSTAVTFSPDMRQRLGVGHDGALKPVPDVNMPAFVPACCLRSTANDLLTLLSAFTGSKASALAPAMRSMLDTRRAGPGLEQAIGWLVVKLAPNDSGFAAFGGQTAGYASTIAYDPATRTGVVVLSNGTQDDGGLSWHLLRPAFPVANPAAKKPRTEITLDARLLDAYAGQYRVATGPTAGDLVTLERRDDVMYMKSPTSPPTGLRLHAESERSFFITEADLHITVDLDAQGHATQIVFHFLGTDTRAPRIVP